MIAPSIRTLFSRPLHPASTNPLLQMTNVPPPSRNPRNGKLIVVDGEARNIAKGQFPNPSTLDPTSPRQRTIEIIWPPRLTNDDRAWWTSRRKPLKITRHQRRLLCNADGARRSVGTAKLGCDGARACEVNG